MAFCTKCGADVQGRFCAKCGAQVDSGEAQGAGPQPAPAQIGAPGLTENVASALCYLVGLLTGILFLVLQPYSQNRTIRFHAFQSIFLHLGLIVVFLGLALATSILRLIPFVGVLLSFVLYPVISLGFFVLWVMLMYKAYNNERWVLPVIGALAEKQAYA
jgi:uncharacterized membrane protein